MTAATEQLWLDFGTALLGYLRRRVGDPHLAEDLLQETFLRVHDGLPRLRSQDRVAPWLYRIASNVVVDHQRRRRDASLTTEPADEAPPDNVNAEVAGWLGAMVDALPGTYREAVRLAELEGLPQRAVAERLGLSLSGAKSRVQRGRERLKGLVLGCCRLELDRRGNVLDYAVRASPCCDPPFGAGAGRPK